MTRLPALPLLALALTVLVVACAPRVSPQVQARRAQVQAMDAITDDARLVDHLLATPDLPPRMALGGLNRLKDPAQVDRLLADPRFRALAEADCGRFAFSQPAYFGLLMSGIGNVGCAHRALGHITDQELMTRYVIERPDGPVVRNALVRITDPALLSRIAAQHPDERIRAMADGKVAHQGVKRRVAQVGRTTDNEALRRSVLTDPDAEVRRAALARITDGRVLHALALTDSLDPQDRSDAVKHLSDQALLADLAVRAAQPGLRGQALERLTDPHWLFHVARQAPTAPPKWDTKPESRGGTRAAAARRLTDPAHRRAVVLGDGDGAVRAAALENATDPDLLARSARDGATDWERQVATVRLGDLALLERLSRLQDNQGALAALRRALVEASGGAPPAAVTLSRKSAKQGYRIGSKHVDIPGDVLTVTIDLANTGAGQDQAVSTRFSPRYPQAYRVRGLMAQPGGPPIAQPAIDRAKFLAPLTRVVRVSVPAARRDALAASAASPLLRVAAMASTPNLETVRAAAQSPDPALRRVVVERLSDGPLLAHLATRDPDAAIRAAAAGRLGDRSLLGTIRDNGAEDAKVRQAARQRLAELELLR
ncbi:MAG: hypothetical protein KDE22_13265 [Rhodobacterales bacterium]|nr:hypothetical protein [Rhodobacterales bacterium]